VRRNLSKKILDSAEQLILQFGFRKVTMDDIAREAGVARATIYLHFRDRGEIGLACADRMHFRLLAHLRHISASSASAAERLRQMLIGRVLFAFDQAQTVSVKYEEMFDAIKPLYMLRREQYFANEARIFLKVLREGLRSAETAVENPPLTALALVLATNALMPFSLSPRQLKARQEVKQRASKIAELLLKSMCKSDGRTGKSEESAGDRSFSR
jgi:AcrR family transcriptional regulator